MAGRETEVGSEYSLMCGFIFLFNLIVGTGALAMPKAFTEAGWLISIIVIVLLAILSYMSVTFVVEAMATANMKLRISRKNSEENDADASIPLLTESLSVPEDVFSIRERVEMGTMASLFFNKYGVIGFYLSLVIYLYGDLSIYSVAVPKSLRDTMCTYQPPNRTRDNFNDPCWHGVDLSRMNVYRLCIVLMALVLSPFVFTNVQKSKYLQAVTSFVRWSGFILMITLGIVKLAKREGTGSPPVATFSGVPNLFGVCIYSFMCHHSLPSIITPVRNKTRLNSVIIIDFAFILVFYSLLAFTAIFATDNLQDLYTLNFLPDTSHHNTTVTPMTDVAFFQYYLALFPVLTLGSSFPILAITLRNNLRVLFSNNLRPYPWIVEHIVFPLVTIIPPFVVAMITIDIDFLVGVTGSYAGSAVQYIIPAMLVYYARKDSVQVIGTNVRNKHRSVFQHSAWVFLLLVWTAVCVVFVTVNHVMTNK